MITEDRVTFEIAKLLEEKGFKGESKGYYDCNGFYFDTPNIVLKESGYSYYPIPSLSVVLKWLREVHGIFIEITCCVNDKYDFYVGVYIKGNECWDRCNYYPEGFETFEEACNTGIEYTLENLI